MIQLSTLIVATVQAHPSKVRDTILYLCSSTLTFGEQSSDLGCGMHIGFPKGESSGNGTIKQNDWQRTVGCDQHYLHRRVSYQTMVYSCTQSACTSESSIDEP
eukprot:scaffold3716_cov69-Cylindrotheca_fusiformis.AAC.22